MSNTYYIINKTKVKENNMHLTAFMGGKNNPNALQITLGDSYITLNQQQQTELAMMILARATFAISATDDLTLEFEKNGY